MSSEFHEITLEVGGANKRNSIDQKFRVETYNNEICGLSLLVEDENGHENAIDVDIWLISLEGVIRETMLECKNDR